MVLTPEQMEVCRLRLIEHRHLHYTIHLALSPTLTLANFIVHSNVLRPEKTSALYFAQFLAQQELLFSGKTVLDMGCGSGVQGIIAHQCGAIHVLFSDISSVAIANTRENIKLYNLIHKSKVYCGDLFEHISQKVDIILFNHPFFSAQSLDNELISKAWFDEGMLIHRFLEEAKNYLLPGGCILMSFFHFAGEINNPSLQAPLHGYKVVLCESIDLIYTNIQKGVFSVFKLQL